MHERDQTLKLLLVRSKIAGWGDEDIDWFLDWALRSGRQGFDYQEAVKSWTTRLERWSSPPGRTLKVQFKHVVAWREGIQL